LAIDVNLAPQVVFANREGKKERSLAIDVDLAPEGVFGNWEGEKKRKLLHRVRRCISLYAINQVL
jgi:hypothetical protein